MCHFAPTLPEKSTLRQAAYKKKKTVSKIKPELCAKKMAAAENIEKRLMRLKKDELKEEAAKRNLEASGTKADLVSKADTR